MTRRIDLQALIDSTPVGKVQWFIIISCFLVAMLDGFDTAAIGFIAPDISIRWQFDTSDLALLFGAGMLGLTAGALVCGPLSDYIGRKRVIQLCVALFGVLSLLSAFSPNLHSLIILRFLTGLGLGGAIPNAVTMTSEYLPTRRKSALVTLMFCGFTLGSAMGGIISAQLLSVIGWRGILVLGGALPLMLFLVLLFALPESPRWQVYRQLPQRIITRTVSAITKENYDNTVFYLKETATISKGSVRYLFVRDQLPITLMLWGVFFMSMLIIYFLSSWMPTLFIHRGMDLHNASLVTVAFQFGGTLGALVLGILMDQYNPFRVLTVGYVLGALCITMIGVSDSGLWLLALATFGTGVGISGSQVGLNALTATLYPTQSRATGVSWSNAIGRCGAILGSFSGGVMIAMNISFDTLFFIIAIPASFSAVMLTLLAIVVRQSASILDPLPRVGVVNNK